MDSSRSNSMTLDNLEWSRVGTDFVCIACIFTSSRTGSASKGLPVQLFSYIHVRKLFNPLLPIAFVGCSCQSLLTKFFSALQAHRTKCQEQLSTQATCSASVLYTLSCKNIEQVCLSTNLLPLPRLGNRWNRYPTRVFFKTLISHRFFSKTIAVKCCPESV